MKFISSVSIAAIALIVASLPSQAQNRPIDNKARALLVSAEPVDATAAATGGAGLHMVRFNPITGTQE